MQQNNEQDPKAAREIGLVDLAETLWDWKWHIAVSTLVLALIAGIAALVLPKWYQASILISPAVDSGSQMSDLASRFSGLSSLIGVSLPNDSRKAESLAVLQSEALTEKYISDNNLLPILYSKLWDPVSNKWVVARRDQIPTLWKANLYFRSNVRDVATDSKTGLVTMTITWRDPVLAAKWANDLVRATNDFLRTKAIQQSEANIHYLTDEAAKTDSVEERQAVYSVMQTEINKVMLAKGNAEYAMRVVDPAVPPEKAFSPKPLIWILMSLFVSVFIFSVAAFVQLLIRAR